jgi:adenylosuccinate synthase
MPAAAILGAQWGDEGKGKVVDLFAPTADLVVRFQGGPNAGHTIVYRTKAGTTKLVLHHIPSALCHEGPRAVMASGMVVDPDSLLGEITQLEAAGVEVTPDRLHISLDAQVILPAHRALDRAREESKKGRFIGTTLRGMGPVYEDRTGRRGIRFRDLLDTDLLRTKVESLHFERNALLSAYGAPTVDLDETMAALAGWRASLEPFFADTLPMIHRAVSEGKRVLFEGAQGAMLDLSFGTYPFVTSSNTTSGGIFVGSGLAPGDLQSVIGVTKAYTTRVGEGPFPSELDDNDGAHLAEQGSEFGATTGRPRRCGWLDLVALRYAHDVCGFTSLAVTKLDVLTGLDRIGVCTSYRLGDNRLDGFPRDPELLAKVEPEFDYLPGWDDVLNDCTERAELPANAEALLQCVELSIGIPASLISVGPERSATIVIEDPLWDPDRG